MDHDTGDQVGVVESSTIDGDRKGRATVRFGKGARASEIFQDVKDGIRRLISVGYRVNKMVTEKVVKGHETLRATSWMPLEISIVSVPADTSVGVGRADATQFETVIENSEDMKRSLLLETMPALTAPAGGGGTPAPAVNIEIIRAEAATAERTRTREINATADRLGEHVPGIRDLAGEAIEKGWDLNEFRRQAFEKVPGVKPIAAKDMDPNLGMPERDIQKYSIRKAILCAIEGKMSGLEGEMHTEGVRHYAKTGTQRQVGTPNSVLIPFDVLAYSQRDQLTGTASIGGNLVATNLLAGSFIDILRARMMVARLGATYLPGLVGNVAIPRQNGAATLYWAASEAGATTESTLTFDQVTMSPKQATARVDYSYLTLLQTTPGVEGLIRNDLANIISIGIDLACLHGSGSSGQPTGIASVSGIGSVAGGTNGAQVAYSHVLALEKAVAVANADMGALAYLSNPKVRNTLKQTYTNATYGEIPVWGKGSEALIGEVNGYPAAVTNQVSSALTKGTSTTVCSATFFGNWQDLLIAQWGGLEILVNPYTQAANRVYELYAYQALDVNVRHPESFAAMLDGLTI